MWHHNKLIFISANGIKGKICKVDFELVKVYDKRITTQTVFEERRESGTRLDDFGELHISAKIIAQSDSKYLQ